MKDPDQITYNRKTLADILAAHGKWLRGEKDGEHANLWGANLRGANLSGANLRGANLRGCIGNMAEIKSMQIERWPVTYTAEVLQIGCQRHPIENWRNADPRWIAAMHESAAEWWAKFGPIILATIDASPATPTGHEAK